VGENLNIFEVQDGVCQAGEKLLWVPGQEYERVGLDCQLDLIGGEAKGQPGRVSHWEGSVELGGEGLKVRCEGGPEGSWVGDNNSKRASVINFGHDGEGESAVCISEDASGNVGEGGSHQKRLRLFSGGRARGVEPSFSRR